MIDLIHYLFRDIVIPILVIMFILIVVAVTLTGMVDWFYNPIDWSVCLDNDYPKREYVNNKAYCIKQQNGTDVVIPLEQLLDDR